MGCLLQELYNLIKRMYEHLNACKSSDESLLDWNHSINLARCLFLVIQEQIAICDIEFQPSIFNLEDIESLTVLHNRCVVFGDGRSGTSQTVCRSILLLVYFECTLLLHVLRLHAAAALKQFLIEFQGGGSIQNRSICRWELDA